MSTWNHGCCVDRAYREEEAGKGRDVSGFPKGCTPETCMALPEGQTCRTCAHHHRCTMIFGAKSENDYCQFFPRRFRLAVTTEETMT